jgi:endoglucanase
MYYRSIMILLTNKTSTSTPFTTSPNDYYPEDAWTDDMELGAIELYLVTNNSTYLTQAASWAKKYINGDYLDTINL